MIEIFVHFRQPPIRKINIKNMLNYTEIFNIDKTTLPIQKKDLSSVLSKKSFIGYVQCPYNQLITTLKLISQAEQYKISINPNELYSQGNNPFHHADCVIQVEGLRNFDEFVNQVVTTGENKEWSDFVTYSETFKDEIKNLKIRVMQKYLWNAQNINNWFNDNSFNLPSGKRQELATVWEKFKNNVLESSDLYSFISSCDEGELQKAANVLRKQLIKKLQKYRSELEHHVMNASKRAASIIISHPVINRIFIVSNYAKQCEKDWPRLKFTALDRRSFEAISLWDDFK